MSKSLLYHGFGIRGYEYRRTDFEDGCVMFSIQQPRESFRCSACGSRRLFSRGQAGVSLAADRRKADLHPLRQTIPDQLGPVL